MKNEIIKLLSEVNWPAILTGAIGFIVLFVIKTLLDLRIGQFIVKWFYWVPVRNYFRAKPKNISGEWEHLWHAGGSSSYAESVSRHGHPIIKQLGHYCYAEFVSKGKKYCFFGQINGNYWVGDWYDIKDDDGYFGAFQLEIVDSNTMRGKWIGHSKQSRSHATNATDIRCDDSEWTRVIG